MLKISNGKVHNRLINKTRQESSTSDSHALCFTARWENSNKYLSFAQGAPRKHSNIPLDLKEKVVDTKGQPIHAAKGSKAPHAALDVTSHGNLHRHQQFLATMDTTTRRRSLRYTVAYCVAGGYIEGSWPCCGDMGGF